jgi:spermidine synthase
LSSKKIISYVYPQVIEEGTTKLGQKYEVNYENGVKVLNSENANYSFGSLHQIMLKGIEEVLKKHKPKRVLILGLGAGSILSIMNKKFKWPYTFKAVELDADIVRLRKLYFDEEGTENGEILCMDAKTAIHQLEAHAYDLIVDDVFWDNSIPEFCKEQDYLKRNKILLAQGGVYMRNTMDTESMNHKEYEKELSKVFSSFYSVKHPVYKNKIYFCQD